MYKLIINRNKSISISEQQFCFLKIINQLGFLNFDQLTLLWSTINKTYVSFSHSNLRKWIKKYQLLNKYIPNQHRTMDVLHPAYYVTSTGIRLLKKYHVDFVPLKYLQINAHNEQCNEVTIQALFKLALDLNLQNNLQQRPISTSVKYLLANPSFDLSKLDLRSFNKQVANSETYSFVPDQMISLCKEKQRKEIFIELDNRTESNLIQIQKIIQYITYAKQHPNIQILMIIASTDGSLPTRRVKKFTPIYRRTHNLLKKFADYQIKINKHNYYLADIYRQTNNLAITVAGVSEAYIDIVDFISDKNTIRFNSTAVSKLTEASTKKTNIPISFRPNKQNQNKINWHGNLLGHIVYQSNPASYQPIAILYEHSLDAYLALESGFKAKGIITYPVRINQSLNAPGLSPQYYKKYLWRRDFSSSHVMCYQPILGINNNPNIIIQLLYLKYHYAKYFYSFFKTGRISESDNTDYHHLTYLHPSQSAIKIANFYLKNFGLIANYESTKQFDSLNALAKTTSCKDFISYLNIQSIPVEVINAILNRIGIKAYSLPFSSPVSLNNKFDPLKHLYLPNAIDPKKRTPIFPY